MIAGIQIYFSSCPGVMSGIADNGVINTTNKIEKCPCRAPDMRYPVERVMHL